MYKIILLIVATTIVYSTPSFAQRITTIAGIPTMGGNSGDGGQATAAKLRAPHGLAIDLKGNIYTGMFNDYYIRKISPSGIITAFAGNGTNGFSGDGGLATDAQLSGSLHGIAFDTKGNVYFVDALNRRVRKVDTFGIITTFAGDGSTIISGDGGMATAAGIGANPNGLTSDTADNIFIEGGGYIRKVDTFGIITKVIGIGVAGFSGDGGLADTARIGGSVQIAFDRHGNLYFVDGNSRIRMVNTAGIISTVAGNGTMGYSGDGGQATNAQLQIPRGVFPDSKGNFYIADDANHRIRKVSSTGIITTVAGSGAIGTGSGGYGGDDGPATAARLNAPRNVYLKTDDTLYIADFFNYCIRRIALLDTIFPSALPEVALGAGLPLLITPSPTSGTFTISLPATATGQVQVTVTDITGRVVATRTATAGKAIPISLAAVPGMYLVTAEASGVRYVGRVQVE